VVATESPLLKSAKNFTGWYIAAAVLFIVLGALAILEPAVAGLGVAILVGWLLVFGGVAHLLAAFQGGGAKQVIWQILIGFVYLVGGVYLLMHPVLALGSLTLLLAAMILVMGVLEIVSYFQLQGHEASGWILFNGIVALLLGGLIWFHWPSSSVWAIGTLVGVNLLFTGIARLMFAMAGRRLIRRVAA
jgi:uncharacterized membrane protein HdeD (DUF308 family)